MLTFSWTTCCRKIGVSSRLTPLTCICLPFQVENLLQGHHSSASLSPSSSVSTSSQQGLVLHPGAGAAAVAAAAVETPVLPAPAAAALLGGIPVASGSGPGPASTSTSGAHSQTSLDNLGKFSLMSPCCIPLSFEWGRGHPWMCVLSVYVGMFPVCTGDCDTVGHLCGSVRFGLEQKPSHSVHQFIFVCPLSVNFRMSILCPKLGHETCFIGQEKCVCLF